MSRSFDTGLDLLTPGYTLRDNHHLVQSSLSLNIPRYEDLLTIKTLLLVLKTRKESRHSSLQSAADSRLSEDLHSLLHVRLPGGSPGAAARPGPPPGAHTRDAGAEAGRGDLPPGHGLHLLLPPLLDSLHLSGERLTRI